MAKGNPFGQVRAKPFREALNMELAAAGEDRKALRHVAQALIAKAMSGDIQAITVLLERTDGKVAQAVVGGDEEDNPIQLALVERRIVHPANTDS